MGDRNTADPDRLPYFRPPIRNTTEPTAPAPTFSGGGGGLSDGDKGDITVSGSGNTLTIDGRAVSKPKLFAVAADKILGRATAGSGDVEELDCTAAGRALLGAADATAQRTALGLGTAATQASTAFEPALGNPAADGYVLQSTAAGVRSWAAAAAGGGDDLLWMAL